MGLQKCESELRAAINTDYSQEESHAYCNCRVRRLLLLADSGGIHVFNVGLAPKLPKPSAEEGVNVTELNDSCWQVEISGRNASSANFTCESGTRQQNQCCFTDPASSFIIIVENKELRTKSGVVVRTRAPTPSELILLLFLLLLCVSFNLSFSTASIRHCDMQTLNCICEVTRQFILSASPSMSRIVRCRWSDLVLKDRMLRETELLHALCRSI